MRLLFWLSPILLLGVSACTDSGTEMEEAVVEQQAEAVAAVESPTVRILANGKVIGFYLEGGQYQMGVISEKGYPFWLSLNDTFGTHGSVIRKPRPFYFKASDCTGNPYVASSGTKYEMWDGEIVRAQDPGDPVQLYYIPQGPEPQKMGFNSVRTSQILRDGDAADVSYTTISKCTAIPAVLTLDAVQLYANDPKITGVADTVQYEMPITIDR